jgi:hypothetical protein
MFARGEIEQESSPRRRIGLPTDASPFAQTPVLTYNKTTSFAANKLNWNIVPHANMRFLPRIAVFESNDSQIFHPNLMKL